NRARRNLPRPADGAHPRRPRTDRGAGGGRGGGRDAGRHPGQRADHPVRGQGAGPGGGAGHHRAFPARAPGGVHHRPVPPHSAPDRLRPAVDTVSLVALTGVDLFAMLGAVLWYALRVGAALQVLPAVGGRGIPARARLITTIALSAALATVMPAPPPMGIDAATVLGALREFSLGVAIGMMLRLAFEAGRLAGELVSVGMGLSFATMADPVSGTSSPVLSQWFYLAFALLFFIVDGHLALVNLLADSYGGVPIGAPLPDAMALASAVPAFFGACLRAGVLLALPVMMALLAVNIAFGVLARAAPQPSPFAAGRPVSLLAGLTLLMLLMRGIEAPVRQLFEDAFLAARALTG